MRIAVTGSSGFVGRRLASALEAKGAEIVGIDKSQGTDITRWDELEALPAFDTMYHLAARIFVPESYENPREFYTTNIIGTLNALELCRKNKARMVYISSYVYGKPHYLPIDEKHPVEAHNPYAESKIMCEKLCNAYVRDFGLSAIIVRPFNLYGPGQNELFLIPKIIAQAKSGRVRLMSAHPKRDFLFVDDFIDALLRVNDPTLSSGTFNVGSGKSHSVEEVVKMIREIVGDVTDVSYEESVRANEVDDTVADISKIRNALSWEPKTSLREGLVKSINV